MAKPVTSETPERKLDHLDGNDHKAVRLQTWRIAVPVIFANSSIPLVAMVDTAVMGHLDHAHYIGSVAMGSFIFSLILAVFGFLRMATTGFVAQAAGAQDGKLVVAHFWRAMVIALILGGVTIVLTPLIILVSGLALTLSEDVASGMATYLSIVCLAAPAITVNMVIIGVLFGLWRIKATVIQLMTVNVINIIGNLVLVYGFGMRVEGVALATAISHYAGLLVTLPLVLSAIRSVAPLSWPAFSVVFNLSAMRQYLSLGFDLTIRTSCIILSELIVLNAASGIDDVALAASQIGFVIFGLIAYPLDGFAHAAEALTGSAIGRRNPVMLRHTLRETTRLAVIMAVLMAAGLALIGPLIIGVLTSIPSVVETSYRILPILVIMPIVSVFAFQMDGVFVGGTMGHDMRNAMLVSMALFVPLVYLLGLWFGLIGVWVAFLFLLGLRGATLWMRLDHVRACAEPKG